MQTTGHPGSQSRLDIRIAQRTEAMARAYVNTHHKGQSDNRIIEVPIEATMSEHDMELAGWYGSRRCSNATSRW